MEKKWRISGRERTRYKARERDNFTCKDCGKVWKEGQRQFDVHHLNGLCGKKSRSYDKISGIDGLITLCHKCHFNRHDWAGRSGLSYKEIIKRDREIRRKHQLMKYNYASLGREYGLSRQRIFQIVNKR